jgi:hypothetical protein
MAAPWLTLAATTLTKGQQEWLHELMWAGPAIAGFLLLMALVVSWVRKWYRGTPQEGLTASDQLAQFRELYERGEISKEEFARVRQLLMGRVKQELNLPPGRSPEIQPPPHYEWITEDLLVAEEETPSAPPAPAPEEKPGTTPPSEPPQTHPAP